MGDILTSRLYYGQLGLSPTKALWATAEAALELFRHQCTIPRCLRAASGDINAPAPPACSRHGD